MTSSHVAAAHSLGFLYQFDRAVYRLLTSSASVIEVGIEDIDDVSEHHRDGTVIREQDKTSVTSKNPLTDRSVALWKTLMIWANAVRENQCKLEDTFFHLVTNGEITSNSLVYRIHHTTKMESAILIARDIREMATGLREDIFQYGQEILLLNETLLAQLLVKIEVFDDVSPIFGGNIDDIPAFRFYDPPIKSAIFDQARGWVDRKIIEAVHSRHQPRVTRVDFENELKAIIRRVHIAPFAMMVEAVDKENINMEDYIGEGFVQQLNWINCKSSRIIDGIIHFIQASRTRQKWTDGLISEGELIEYREDLCTKWELIRDRVELLPYLSTDEAKGQALLNETILQTSYINAQPMPTSFTAGCYHELANFKKSENPRVGWHPDYEELVKSARGAID